MFQSQWPNHLRGLESGSKTSAWKPPHFLALQRPAEVRWFCWNLVQPWPPGFYMFHHFLKMIAGGAPKCEKSPSPQVIEQIQEIATEFDPLSSPKCLLNYQQIVHGEYGGQNSRSMTSYAQIIALTSCTGREMITKGQAYHPPNQDQLFLYTWKKLSGTNGQAENKFETPRMKAKTCLNVAKSWLAHLWLARWHLITKLLSMKMKQAIQRQRRLSAPYSPEEDWFQHVKPNVFLQTLESQRVLEPWPS